MSAVNSPALEFDAEAHAYRLNGKSVPSVTQVLGSALLYAGVPAHVMELARQRGNAVHRGIELMIRRTLDASTVDPRVLPYLQQFALWVRQSGFRVIGFECRVASVAHGYAGTADLIGCLPSLGPGIDVIDTKATHSIMPTVGPQTAGYALAYAEMNGLNRSAIRRHCLHLAPTRHQLLTLPDAADYAVFLSSLNIWRFCDANGII